VKTNHWGEKKKESKYSSTREGGGDDLHGKILVHLFRELDELTLRVGDEFARALGRRPRAALNWQGD
jgi:hypothetical protein